MLLRWRMDRHRHVCPPSRCWLRHADRWRRYRWSVVVTAELVRRLLSEPVTTERAIKVLRHLETQGQLAEVLAAVDDEQRGILEAALPPSVVAAHFARRGR